MTRLLTAPVRAFGAATVHFIDSFALMWCGVRFGLHPDFDLLED